MKTGLLDRPVLMGSLRRALRRSRIVALLGPRQCGKTTLARVLLPVGADSYFDLEDPEDLARLESPKAVLAPLKGLVVLDEIQRRPDLFPLLRVLADRRPLPARFLLLGSASPALLKEASESLAGRIETLEMGGLGTDELPPERMKRLWLRGGMPRSFLARSDADSYAWRGDYLRAAASRDLPALGMGAPSPEGMRRFLSMTAHYHGQIWSSSDPARSLGVSDPTIRRWLDLLTGAFLVRQLQPWHENLGKRQVKSPKVYWRDSGLLHSLLGLRTPRDIEGHPKRGASWEGFAIEILLRALRPDDAYFWATHGGAELDLLVFKGGARYGFEVKLTDSPRKTPSMEVARKDLGLRHLFVIHSGEKTFPLDDGITALPLAAVVDKGDSLIARRK